MGMRRKGVGREKYSSLSSTVLEEGAHNFFVEGETGKIRFGQLGDRLFSSQDQTVLVQVKPNPISGKYIFVSIEE